MINIFDRKQVQKLPFWRRYVLGISCYLVVSLLLGLMHLAAGLSFQGILGGTLLGFIGFSVAMYLNSSDRPF